MNRLHILAILIIFTLVSCFKEDEMVTPHDPGDVETDTISITEISNNQIVYYRNQVYYDLLSGKVISENGKSIWDLGFEAAEEGWHIILNTATFMYAANTGLTDFKQPIDTAGLVWKFDKSDGDLDSTAIGNWLNLSSEDSSFIFPGYVYVINRGYDEQGNMRGLRKIVFHSLQDDHYSFKYADFDGSNEVSATVSKDPTVNFVQYSFDTDKEQLALEPGKYEWDLIFTQYTTLLFTEEGEPYPYLVTGVLSNRAGVVVASDTLMDFNNIDRATAEEMSFSSSIDEIGYDWKILEGDINTGNIVYVINTDINYVIRDPEGFFYKLRFIGFYNHSGIKGFPSFEYQRL